MLVAGGEGGGGGYLMLLPVAYLLRPRGLIGLLRFN
jgi:hypothetical protein